MDKKILAIAIVVIVIAAALIGGLYAVNQGGDHEPTQNYAGEVRIFGNANNDDTIDNQDIETLRSIIENNDYSKSKYPYADANQDGRISQEDIDLVQAIIDGKTAEIRYLNYFDDVRTVHYPITGDVGVNYWQQAEIMAAIGLWDRVSAVDDQTITRTNQYPGIADMYNLGSRDSMQAETILSSGISAMICHGNASSSTEQLIQDFENAGKTIDIICLGWEGINCLSTALMLGIFFQNEEGAHKYVDWCNSILDNIQTKIAQLPEDEKATMIVPLMYATQTNSIRIECEGTGSYSLLSYIADVIDLPDATYETKNRAYRDAEWFIQENENGMFDYIMIMEEGTGTGSTPQEYNERFEYSLTFLDNTKAYREGRVGGTTYGFGGFSGFSLLTYAAHMVYPELFSEEEGLDAMQYWYDNFTFQDIDVKDKGWRYTGTAYQEYNDRLN